MAYSCTFALDLQDDATVAYLSAPDKSGDIHSWFYAAYAWLFTRDIFEGVASDDKLLRIHTTAEEFDPAAEQTFVPFQVPRSCNFYPCKH